MSVKPAARIQGRTPPRRMPMSLPWRRQARKSLLLLLYPLTLLIKRMALADPQVVENIYAQRIYPAISRVLDTVFGQVSFSIAEWLLYASPLLLGVLIWRAVRQETLALRVCSLLLSVALIAACGYFAFIGLWGLNYYRLPYAQLAGYDTHPSSVAELADLCRDLVHRAALERARCAENAHGLPHYPGGYTAALGRVSSAYEALGRVNPLFTARYRAPKRVWNSRALSASNITGIFIPFTMESNVNTHVLTPYFYSTACHEMAHKYGFAREDEANFIAYLACIHSDRAEERYSGLLLALVHSLNALHTYDNEEHSRIYTDLDTLILYDLNKESAYWAQFEGPVAEASTRINHMYLKSNNQADGTHSYGRMVDLLLAQHRQSDY